MGRGAVDYDLLVLGKAPLERVFITVRDIDRGMCAIANVPSPRTLTSAEPRLRSSLLRLCAAMRCSMVENCSLVMIGSCC
jgi:hypothetical protein